MSNLFTTLKDKVKGKELKIVFPEGTDERILTAASRLSADGILTPIVVGNVDEVNAKADQLGVKLDGCDVVDPASFAGMDELVKAFVERRKGKATEEDAKKILLDGNYFGTMLVYTGQAHGLVSGAAHSTADTVRPALQIIKTKEGVRKTSGSSLWYVKTRSMYSLTVRSISHLTARIWLKSPSKVRRQLICSTSIHALRCLASRQKDRLNHLKRKKW